jgi:G3E family GTPase
VVLNHADRASAAQLAAARHWVAQDAAARQAAPPPVLCTEQAALPVSLLAAALYQPHGGGLRAAPVDHGQVFEAWQQQPAGRFDPARLLGWLRDLPPGVLRLKGRLPLAGLADASATATGTATPTAITDWAELQFAGRHATLRRGPPRPGDTAAVVAIGLAGRLPAQALLAGLQACQAPPAPSPGAAGLK